MPTVLWGKGTGGDLVMPWAGNSLLEGCRLVGAGGPDDDVLLDWCQFTPDEHTIGLWHMNEAAWNGTPGEVLDSSGNGNHGTAVNGANTGAGWLDRNGEFDSAGSQYVLATTLGAFGSGLAANPTTLETWLRTSSSDVEAIGGSFNAGTATACDIRLNWKNNAIVPDYIDCFIRGDLSKWLHGYVYAPQAFDGSWHHVALIFEPVSAALAVYVDGASLPVTYVSQQPLGASSNFTYSWTLAARNVRGTVGWHFDGGLDEYRLSKVARYTGNFSPTRYPAAGSVTAQYTPAAPQRLTAIAWDGVFGPSTGRLRRVWAYSGGAWQQVGGEYPASPITGLDLPVEGPDLVRVELEPRDDALQSETPTLDWLQVALEAVPTPPQRTRITAGLDRQRLEARAGTRLAALLERDRLDTRSD